MNNNIIDHTPKEATDLIEKKLNAKVLNNYLTSYDIRFEVKIDTHIPFCLKFVFNEQFPTFIIENKNIDNINSLISYLSIFNCVLFGKMHQCKDNNFWQEGRLEIDIFKQ